MRRAVAFRILLHDLPTTAGSVLGVMAIIFLVGQQLSLLFGLMTYMSSQVDHSGADVWVLSEDAAYADAASLIPERYAERLAGLAEVAWAEPVLSGGGSFRRGDGQTVPVRVIGARPPRLAGGPWRYAEGSPGSLLEYDAVTVDAQDLRNLGSPGLGAITEIGGRRVRIAAVTDGAQSFGGTLVFTNLAKAREITGTPPGRCSAILVGLRPGAAAGPALDRMRALLPRSTVLETTRLSAMTRRYYLLNTGIGGSFGFSTLIGAAVGIVILSLTMFTSVKNRVKDFAVLRALGARRRDIFVVVLLQAVMISAAGIFLGFLVLAALFDATRASRIPNAMFPAVPPVHALATFLVCVLVSLLSMRRALRIEPASAFR